MYRIPLTNSPNQTFNITVPVNGENKDFTINLNYSEIADYWTIDISDTLTEQMIICGIPLLESYNDFANLLIQQGYLEIGSIFIVAMQETKSCRPDDKDIGQKYLLVWGDNF